MAGGSSVQQPELLLVTIVCFGQRQRWQDWRRPVAQWRVRPLACFAQLRGLDQVGQKVVRGEKWPRLAGQFLRWLCSQLNRRRRCCRVGWRESRSSLTTTPRLPVLQGWCGQVCPSAEPIVDGHRAGSGQRCAGGLWPDYRQGIQVAAVAKVEFGGARNDFLFQALRHQGNFLAPAKTGDAINFAWSLRNLRRGVDSIGDVDAAEIGAVGAFKPRQVDVGKVNSPLRPSYSR